MAFSALNVTLIDTFMRHLETGFGGTRTANNSVLNSAGITRLPLPSTSTIDPSMILTLGGDV